MILESSYANGLVTPALNKSIQEKLFNKIDTDDVGTIWAGTAFGIISNYVPTQERKTIFKALKATVVNSEVPLASRMGAADALGYVESCPVKDISELLKTLGTDMKEETFIQGDNNGVVSFYLFKSLAHIYLTTGNYEAKDKILQYANMDVSVYPLTQVVWANIAAGSCGFKEVLFNLEKIAKWHDVNSVSDLHGVGAIPINMSQVAWSLIPKYIRDAKGIAEPEVTTAENVAGWTLWTLDAIPKAALAVIATEMAMSSIVSMLYGVEAASASSYFAADLGNLIASKYGATLSYELSLNTTSREFAHAFATTTTGKVVNRILDKVNAFNQKFGAQISKLKSTQPPLVKIKFEDASGQLLRDAIDNSVEGEFNPNWWVESFNSPTRTLPDYTPSGGGSGYPDVAVMPKVTAKSPVMDVIPNWTLPKTILNSTNSNVAPNMAVLNMPNGVSYLVNREQKKVMELSKEQLQEWKHPTKLVEEFKDKELVTIDITRENGEVVKYTTWLDKGEKGEQELARLLPFLKTLGEVKVTSSTYDQEGKLISKQDSPYNIKNTTEASSDNTLTEEQIKELKDLYLTTIEAASDGIEETPSTIQIKLITKLEEYDLDLKAKLKMYYSIMKFHSATGEAPLVAAERLVVLLENSPLIPKTFISPMLDHPVELQNPEYLGVFWFYDKLYDDLANNYGNIGMYLNAKAGRGFMPYKKEYLEHSIKAALYNAEAANKFGLISNSAFEQIQKELSKGLDNLDYATVKDLGDRLLVLPKEFLGFTPAIAVHLPRMFHSEQEVIALWNSTTNKKPGVKTTTPKTITIKAKKLDPFVDAPTTEQEYQQMVSALKKAGYFHIQTMRERAIIANWDNKTLREKIIQDYLGAMKRKYGITETPTYKTKEELFGFVDKLDVDGHFDDVNEDMPLNVTNIEIGTDDTPRIVLAGSVNGGRRRILSELYYRIIDKNKLLYITLMNTAAPFLNKGYSEKLFSALITKYPVDRVFADLGGTNLIQFKKVTEETLGYTGSKLTAEKESTVTSKSDSPFAKAIISGVEATTLHHFLSKLGYDFSEASIAVDKDVIYPQVTWARSKVKKP